MCLIALEPIREDALDFKVFLILLELLKHLLVVKFDLIVGEFLLFYGDS